MEVILLKDVRRLGQPGDIKRVANGYARNYLIPRGLAAPATAAALREAEERAAANARLETKAKRQAEVQAVNLGKVELLFAAKAGEAGRLYGSVTKADIAEQLSLKLGQEVDRRKVLLDDPIKEVGESEVDVALHSNVKVTVTVIVEAEEAS